MGNGLPEPNPNICLCPDDRELEFDHFSMVFRQDPGDDHSFSIVHGPRGGQSTF